MQLLPGSLPTSIIKDVKMRLFDARAGNSHLAKSLSEKSNNVMHEDENPHGGLQSLQNYQI